MTNAQNPLLSDEFRIPFHEIRAEHVEPGIRQALEEAQAEIDAISDGTSPPTWANTIARMDAMSEVLGERFTPASHLVTVCESPELREAFGESCIRTDSETHDGGTHARYYWLGTATQRDLFGDAA